MFSSARWRSSPSNTRKRSIGTLRSACTFNACAPTLAWTHLPLGKGSGRSFSGSAISTTSSRCRSLTCALRRASSTGVSFAWPSSRPGCSDVAAQKPRKLPRTTLSVRLPSFAS
eukprot:Amastigsp_a511698_494.p3 type:complete len:114 gc:universal Amastigsp_a511698_494:176-517(+)